MIVEVRKFSDVSDKKFKVYSWQEKVDINMSDLLLTGSGTQWKSHESANQWLASISHVFCQLKKQYLSGVISYLGDLEMWKPIK